MIAKRSIYRSGQFRPAPAPGSAQPRCDLRTLSFRFFLIPSPSLLPLPHLIPHLSLCSLYYDFVGTSLSSLLPSFLLLRMVVRSAPFSSICLQSPLIIPYPDFEITFPTKGVQV